MVRFRRLILVPLGLVLALVLLHSFWLPFFGEALVHQDQPVKSDIAVVLGGDYYGHRIEKAAQLVKDGYVPEVLVDGPPGFYGSHESDLAIPFIVREGNNQTWFIPFQMQALSTKEEASVVVPELIRRKAHTFLLVTSTYHTARARRIFLAELKRHPGAPAMRVIAAPDEFFRAKDWWKDRESRKITFIEWCKTLAEAFRL